MEILEHHIKTEPCTTRPEYRAGKKNKNVKVYSCALESKYLIVTNIPSLNLDKPLIKLFEVYGAIEEHKPLHDYPSPKFFEAHLIRYQKIQNARCAKIKLDDHNFYGSILHICYAPEHETLNDLRDKISERKYIVSIKCQKYDAIGFGTPEYDAKIKTEPTKFKPKQHHKKGTFKGKTEPKIESQEVKSNERDPMVKYPELPENWVKPTITGSASYDETVNEISQKLKRTIPVQQPVGNFKRKKTLQL